MPLPVCINNKFFPSCGFSTHSSNTIEGASRSQYSTPIHSRADWEKHYSTLTLTILDFLAQKHNEVMQDASINSMKKFTTVVILASGTLSLGLLIGAAEGALRIGLAILTSDFFKSYLYLACDTPTDLSKNLFRSGINSITHGFALGITQTFQMLTKQEGIDTLSNIESLFKNFYYAPTSPNANVN